MAVPLLDLGRQYSTIKDEMDAAVMKVLDHRLFVLGPEVKELEEEIAKLCAVDYGIGVASGTDALLIALRAAGVMPGDEVITTNFSFFATAGVISRIGAKPVFIDIEADSYNIDPNLIEAVITNKTKAIMPVHLFGQMADMDLIMEIAKKHNLKVVEDAAQAIGATYKGRPAGSIGDYGCFSFYPTKNLGAAGDGGMIVCNDEESAVSCRSLRAHGEKPKYFHHTVGYNSRLDTLQAAILLVKLQHLQKWSETRRKHASIYDNALSSLSTITTPIVKDYTTFHIYNQYTLASENRETLLEGLNAATVGYCIYYPLSFHEQKCFADLGYKESDFPISKSASESVFSIPVYPELTTVEQTEVIETIIKLASK